MSSSVLAWPKRVRFGNVRLGAVSLSRSHSVALGHTVVSEMQIVEATPNDGILDNFSFGLWTPQLVILGAAGGREPPTRNYKYLLACQLDRR